LGVNTDGAGRPGRQVPSPSTTAPGPAQPNPRNEDPASRLARWHERFDDFVGGAPTTMMMFAQLEPRKERM
jgi:hypothetical protein